jgi:ligand-binding sensor domain-containing protein/uncharacterized membrane-anchored protein YhcB (DUF1043 family)
MRRLLFLIIFSVCSKILFANSPIFKELEISNYYQDLSINVIEFDPNGYMYLGTNEGLFSYDGFKFSAIVNTEKIKNITAIYFYNSKVFIGNKKGNIYVSDYHDETHAYKLIASVEAEIADIKSDDKGNIWVASLGAGLLKLSSSTKDFKLQKYKENLYCYDLEFIEKKIWVASDEGIFNIDANAKIDELENINDAIADRIVTALNYTSGNLYVGTESKGYFIYNLRKKYFQAKNQLSHLGEIKNINYHHEMVWLLTIDSGLVNVNVRAELNTFNKRNAKLDKSVSDLKIDREGNIWLATLNNKLISFNTSFQKLNLTQNSNNILCVYQDRSKKIWYSDSKNIYVHQHKKTQKVLGNLPDLNVVSIHEDEFGYMWFGTFDKGLIRYHPKKNTYRFFNIKNGLINDNILSMASDKGYLWLATLGGVSKIKYAADMNANYVIENFDKEDGIGSNFIYQVFIDSKHRIWFATDGKGITVFENNKFKNYSIKEGLMSKTIYSITEDANGLIWLNTAKDGLVYYDGKVFKKFTREDGLRSYTNAGIVADHFENLLVISNKGVDMINVKTKNIHYHDSEIDFLNLEPNINAYHRPNNSNEIWFASQNNIYVYYQGFQELWNGPKTLLRNVKVNSELIDYSMINEFEYNQNYFSFDVIGLWYHKPSEVKYRYKLEGYDVNWIQTTDNTINYSKLPPGNYVFKISSSANSSFNDAKVIEYKFEVLKPYWLRTWFIVLVLAVLVALILFISMYRIQRLKKREQYERERVKFELDTLRNQINPHFLFNSFNTLIGLIEIDTDRAVKYVEHLSDFYRELLNHRDLDVISLKQELDLLKSYIFILDQRFANKLFVNIKVAEKFLTKNIAALSLQLLVENAIKHNEVSREKPLVIDIYIEGDSIVVTNKKQKHTHEIKSTKIGLENIKNRYKLFSNKSIEIIDDDNNFTVKLPLID